MVGVKLGLYGRIDYRCLFFFASLRIPAHSDFCTAVLIFPTHFKALPMLEKNLTLLQIVARYTFYDMNEKN